MVVQPLRKTGRGGASQPAADGLLTNRKQWLSRAERGRAVVGQSHLGSRQRGESGISVHVVRAGGREVECASTTSLPNPFRADNVLKHDT